MLELDVQQIVSQALSFLILVWVLRRFAWRPLLGALDARRQHIEDELKKVADHREELMRTQQGYEARIAKIDEEARGKIQEAIKDGKRIASEIQEEARAQANRIMTKSKETVELELAKAKVTLRDQVAEMTMNAVERIIHQKLDAKSDRQLVDATLDELERQPETGSGPTQR